MRLHLSRGLFGLACFGLQLLIWTTAPPARAADVCPCKPMPDGSCVPDRDCEERLRAQHERQRLQMERMGSGSGHEIQMYRQNAPSISVERMPAPTLPTPSPPPATMPAPSAAEAPSASMPAGGAAPKWRGSGGVPRVAMAPRDRILDTGWARLMEIGNETEGYGLYSYVILTNHSPSAVSFLTRLFTDVHPIESLPAKPSQLNILYVPLRKDKEAEFATLQDTARGNPGKMATAYAGALYDYGLARRLLYLICDKPQDEVRELCAGELSGGPYLFTYRQPATALKTVAPPYLFVDLTGMPTAGYGEMLAAFHEQVKRTDETDRQRIDTLRLTALRYVLRAAPVVDLGEAAVARMFHLALGDDKSGDKPKPNGD